RYHLMEIHPLTGRHHQIRAQLSAMGCPIKGDLKYGSKRSNPDGSIHLHARSLSFKHPVKLEPTTITAPVPGERMWQVFDEMLKKS
ncbi:MAG TPA: RNA pseudouridine synthase, partial [Bacteroidia bacterium]|nr:RNA pseudouridine synthase [Bacteroidia bacterium]